MLPMQMTMSEPGSPGDDTEGQEMLRMLPLDCPLGTISLCILPPIWVTVFLDTCFIPCRLKRIWSLKMKMRAEGRGLPVSAE